MTAGANNLRKAVAIIYRTYMLTSRASTFSLPLRRHSKTVVGEIHGWTLVRRANVIVAPYKSRLIAEEYGPVYQNYCRPRTHCNLWPVIEEGSAHPTKLLSRKYMNSAATTAVLRGRSKVVVRLPSDDTSGLP